MSKLYELFHILDVTASDCKEALLTGMNDYEKSKVQAILPDQLIRMVSQNDV